MSSPGVLCQVAFQSYGGKTPLRLKVSDGSVCSTRPMPMPWLAPRAPTAFCSTALLTSTEPLAPASLLLSILCRAVELLHEIGHHIWYPGKLCLLPASLSLGTAGVTGS